MSALMSSRRTALIGLLPASELHAGRIEHLDRPYPGGESWRQAVHRVSLFLSDLPLRWNGAGSW
jgi:broad specificity phosphatase PhoE